MKTAPATGTVGGASAVGVATARAQLAALQVKGRAPLTGYSRDQFGQAWLDVDRNGCDTRNDMLRAQLTAVVFANSGQCRVASGTLADPYTGTTIPFVRGQGTSEKVQIDHLVALADAWQKGAQQLSAQQRAAFANDPVNLQATDGPTNQRKGAGDAATWLPPNTAYRCTYVSRQISVKATYRLWVTGAEKAAMTRVLDACGTTGGVVPAPIPADRPPATPAPAAPAPAPAQPVPAAPAPAPAAPAAPAPAAPAPAAPAPAAPAPAAAAYYKNCTAARAAGVAPLLRGQPGYAPRLDRDGDGIACE
ncbi:deoxyribonuclease [Tersicoccus phoenicis]|uniref:Deoxyribonuclease n=1 Tax=Tersicoccus phoenicis TaxID=554083 RepID=A0A1R1LBH1_9MICC|nr:deoxyribonuclease [Tersicoccus phoenicis]